MSEPSDDKCHYGKCGGTLGAWTPMPMEGYVEMEVRHCDKCGGEQSRWRANEEQNKELSELFEVLNE